MIRLLFVLLIAPAISFAQKKAFYLQPVIQGSLLEVMKSMPVIEGWADDDHYLELRKDAYGKEMMMLVEATTGKADTIYKSWRKGTANKRRDKYPASLPIKNSQPIPSRIIIYMLPSFQQIKKLPLTTDGSALIMNGYASWVYYEEILGRASEYRGILVVARQQTNCLYAI